MAKASQLNYSWNTTEPKGNFKLPFTPWASYSDTLQTNIKYVDDLQSCCRETECLWLSNYNDVIMSTVASQITSGSIVGSGVDQRKHRSSASLAFVRGIHRGPVNSPHKGPVTRKMFLFDDVIMRFLFSPQHTRVWVRRMSNHISHRVSFDRYLQINVDIYVLSCNPTISIYCFNFIAWTEFVQIVSSADKLRDHANVRHTLLDSFLVGLVYTVTLGRNPIEQGYFFLLIEIS